MRLTSGWWKTMSPETLRADLAAGMLGAILVLPQGIAFATLAGLPPEYGLYSAVVPTIVAAVFGSSLHVVSGPTNANSLALFAALSPLAVAFTPQYIALALALTVMVGVIQFGVGALRLGALADFISPSVLLGFTSGAAMLIALYALKDLLALDADRQAGPLGVIYALASGWRSVPPASVAVGGITLIVTALLHRFAPRLPFMLIGMAVGFGTAIALRIVYGIPVHVVGPIPSTVPSFVIPDVSYGEIVGQLLLIAPALAIVALGQAVSIAKAISDRSGQQLDVNHEFVGQGLSNILGGFFSAYLSCGSLNRSMPNYQAGARTPLASVLAAGFVLGLAALTEPLLEQIPIPAVGALLLYTAWGLFGGRKFMRLAKSHRLEFAVAAATFVGMLVLPFHIAIGVGVGISLAAYLRRTSHPSTYALVPDGDVPGRPFCKLEEFSPPRPECPQLKLLRMEGSVYYAAVRHVAERLQEIRVSAPLQKHLLVMATSMNFVDLAGADLWQKESAIRRKAGGDIYFHRPRTSVLESWEKTGFLNELATEHIFQSKAAAIGHIFCRLDPEICARCTVRIFTECRSVRPLIVDPPENGLAKQKLD